MAARSDFESDSRFRHGRGLRDRGCASVAGSKMQMRVCVTGKLPDDIKEPEKNERAARDPREPGPDAIAQRDAEPGDDETEGGGKSGVPGGRDRRDGERLGAAPALSARGQDEGQPVRRDGRVEKRDAESGDGNRGENGIVHRFEAQINTDLHG